MDAEQLFAALHLPPSPTMEQLIDAVEMNIRSRYPDSKGLFVHVELDVSTVTLSPNGKTNVVYGAAVSAYDNMVVSESIQTEPRKLYDNKVKSDDSVSHALLVLLKKVFL